MRRFLEGLPALTPLPPPGPRERRYARASRQIELRDAYAEARDTTPAHWPLHQRAEAMAQSAAWRAMAWTALAEGRRATACRHLRQSRGWFRHAQSIGGVS